jgi:hypothetical protein
MTDQASPNTPPIVCDMTSAPDTAAGRVAEYERLFTEALIERARTDGGIRFRFRADPGVEGRVRDLAAREKACCAWFDFAVTADDDEVSWDASVVDDDMARQGLDEFYRLPDTVGEGAAALLGHFADQGLEVMINDNGTLRSATSAELGLS